MASNPEEVRKAAIAELARRELARRAQSAPAQPAPQMSTLEAARLTMNPIGRLGLGAGEAALSVGTGMVAAPINHYWNAMMEAGELPTGDPVGTYLPKTPEGQGILSGVDKAMRLTGIPQAIEKGTDLQNPDPAVRATGNLIAGTLGVLPGIGALRARSLRRAAIPSRDEIKAASQQAYARAEASGGMLPQQNLGQFVQQAEQILAKEGIDKELHPRTMAALNRLYDDASRPGIAGHSVQGAETLRRVLANAETEAIASSKPGAVSSDARLAGKLLDEFDAFMDKELPSATSEYRNARALWNTQRKAQDIEQLLARAENQASQFSVSGMENALRSQFKSLADNPRRLGRFSEAEQSAILKVARGGPLQDSLRWLGKFAPTGQVPAITALAAENTAPGLGAVLASLGIAGRAGASALRKSRARDVDELIRSGAIAPMGARLPRGQSLPQLGYLPAASQAIEQQQSPPSIAEWLLNRPR